MPCSLQLYPIFNFVIRVTGVPEESSTGGCRRCAWPSATIYGTEKDQDNQKLLRMLRRYHQRGDLLRFLEDPSIEPTNNRVERMLRPAVIARKVSQCSKTWPGADAFAAFTSIIQTLLKGGTPSSVVEALIDLFQAPRSQTAPA